METIASESLALVWRPGLAPQHIIGLAGVLAALAVFAYARSFRDTPRASIALLLMRLTVIATLAVVLMGPSTVPPPTTKATKPELFVLADTSGSMLTEDCDGEARLAAARRRWLNPKTLAALSELYDVRLLGFDAEVRPLSEASFQRPVEELATGRTSQIAQCVRDTLQRIDAESGEAALLVVSDGHDTGEAPMRSLALLARARGVPVHTICVGGPTYRRDLVLAAMAQQQYLLAGETGHILAKVRQVGLAGAETTLTLQSGDTRTTHPVRFGDEDVVTVKLPVRQDRPGLHEYQVSVGVVAGEAEAGNNAQSVFLEVTAQQIRVLLLEGEPYWDTKFIAQSLRKDARIDFTQITQLSRGKQEKILTRQQGAPVVPATPEAFAAYDVIILGRGIEHLLDAAAMKLLREYVADQGGHVIFARGRAYDAETALGRRAARDIAMLEPVVWGRGLLHNLSLSVTPAGRSNPCFGFAGLTEGVEETVAKLPGFTLMPVVERAKTATIVLANAVPAGRATGPAQEGQMPALASMSYGRGGVVAVLGEGLWRWSFLPPGLAEFDNVYTTFWSNLIRWQAMSSAFLPGQDVSLKLNPSSAQLGSPVVLEVTCKLADADGFAPTLTVTAPDGETHAVTLARQRGTTSRLQGAFVGKDIGVYTATLESPQSTPARIEKKFSLYDANLEKLYTSAKPDEMRVLAELSDGLFLQQDSTGDLPAELARLRARQAAPRAATFVWDTWMLLVGLLGWAGAEWILRRRAGLL